MTSTASAASAPAPVVTSAPAAPADVVTPAAPAGEAVETTVAGKGSPPDTRTPAQIEADLIATRARLAGRIDELQQYVAPRAVAARGLGKVKRIYVDEYGGIRPERVVATVAVVAVLIGLRALRRRSR